MAFTRRGFIERSIIIGSSMILGGCKREARGSSDPVNEEDKVINSNNKDNGSDVDKSGKRPEELYPAYVKLEASGKFKERVDQVYAMLENCKLCPRKCGVNRLAGTEGYCKTGNRAVVNSHSPHFGEEIPLVGRRGSGTIFFSNCALRCVFCQNWPIAHEGRGRRITDDQLAERMLFLQKAGCANINTVTPTHMMPFILRALRTAMKQGLRIPVVWNTSGYELPEVISLLEDIVDIYLPDMKFMDEEHARKFTAGARRYPENALASLKEMHRQVGDLVTGDSGTARRGLMIRHLVMPNKVSGTKEFVEWIAENLSKNTYLNIMAQYRVEHEAFNHPEIARAITTDEFLEAMQYAEDAGLTNLDSRSLSQRNLFRRRQRFGR